MEICPRENKVKRNWVKKPEGRDKNKGTPGMRRIEYIHMRRRIPGQLSHAGSTTTMWLLLPPRKRTNFSPRQMVSCVRRTHCFRWETRVLAGDVKLCKLLSIRNNENLGMQTVQQRSEDKARAEQRWAEQRNIGRQDLKQNQENFSPHLFHTDRLALGNSDTSMPSIRVIQTEKKQQLCIAQGSCFCIGFFVLLPLILNPLCICLLFPTSFEPQ